MEPTISLTKFEYRNFSGDDTWHALSASSFNSLGDSSVGAMVAFRYTLDLSGDHEGTPIVWSNTRVSLNLGEFLPLLLPITTLPPAAYWYQLPNAGTTGGEVVMNYTGPAEQLNGLTKLEMTNPNTLVITQQLTVTADLRRFLATAGAPALNPNRFRHPSLTAVPPAPMDPPADVLTPTVYGSSYTPSLTSFRFFLHAANPHGWSVNFDHETGYFSRWYAKTTGGVLPAELGDEFVSWCERDGLAVSGVSMFASTDVVLKIAKTTPDLADAIGYALLVRTDLPGNMGGTFMQDNVNGWDHIAIDPDPGSWTFRYTINPTYHTLDPTGKYMVVFVLVVKDGSTKLYKCTNSYYAGPYEVNGPATPIDMTGITGTIKDYNVDPGTDYVGATVIDWLRFEVELPRDAYDSAASSLDWANDMDTDLFRIETSFYDPIEGDDVLWYDWQPHPSGNWVTPAAQFRLFQDDVGAKRRFRFEIPMPGPHVGGFLDWSNRTIEVRWKFIFKYPSADTLVEYRYTQKIIVQAVKGFDDVIQKIELFSYESGLPLLNLCDEELVVVKVTLRPGPEWLLGKDWNIRAYWNTGHHAVFPSAARGGISNHLQEHEAYPSPINSMVPLTDPRIIDLPALFSGPDNNVATFLFDAAGLGSGTQVRIFVIAQPETYP